MRISIYLTFFVLLTGCSDRLNFQTANMNSILFNFRNNDTIGINVPVSVKMVSLETKDNILVGCITKLFQTDNYYIIADKAMNQILVFDNNGSLLRQIGSKGTEKGQFQEVTDMMFYEDKELIEIFSIPERKFLRYKLNGQLISETKTPIDFLAFYKVNEGYWIYGCFDANKQEGLYHRNRNRSNLLLVSDDFSTIEASFCESKNFYDRINDGTNFQTNSKGELFFHYGYSDIVYKLENSTATPYLFLDFGKDKLPYDYILNVTNHKDFEYEVFQSPIKHEGMKSRLQIGDRLMTFECSRYVLDTITPRQVVCFTDSLSYRYSGIHLSDAPLNLQCPVSIKKNKVIFSVNPRIMDSKAITYINNTYNLHVNSTSNPVLIIADEKDII